LSIVCSASSEVSRSATSDRSRLTPPSDPTPARFVYLCDDQHRRRGHVHGLVGLRPFTVRTCRLGRRALHPGSLASSLRRRHTFACISASSPATAPPRPNQSAGHGHYGPTRHDRPDPVFMPDRAPLLRFRVPFSTHRPRRALIPKAAGLRTCPAPAFCARLSPALACHGPDDRRTLRPCGFPLYQQGQCGVARSSGRFGAEFCDSAFSRVARDAIKRTEPCRLNSRRLRSVARVRSVKPTRLMIFPHARGGPADRAALSATPPRDLAARAGHAPTRPLRAAFRYPHPGAVARPCRTSGPSLCRLPRPAALLGFVPFAGLIPSTGGHAVQAPRLNVPISDISA